jgi:hypothetical protein
MRIAHGALTWLTSAMCARSTSGSISVTSVPLSSTRPAAGAVL